MSVCISGKKRFFFRLSGRYDSGSCDDMQRIKDTNAKEPAEDEGILEKADRLVSEKISVIHVGVCRLNEEKKECPRITQICGLIEERGIKVIRGTHKE